MNILDAKKYKRIVDKCERKTEIITLLSENLSKAYDTIEIMSKEIAILKEEIDSVARYKDL